VVDSLALRPRSMCLDLRRDDVAPGDLRRRGHGPPRRLRPVHTPVRLGGRAVAHRAAVHQATHRAVLRPRARSVRRSHDGRVPPWSCVLSRDRRSGGWRGRSASRRSRRLALPTITTSRPCGGIPPPAGCRVSKRYAGPSPRRCVPCLTSRTISRHLPTFSGPRPSRGSISASCFGSMRPRACRRCVRGKSARAASGSK
jgi:hypothetical protein